MPTLPTPKTSKPEQEQDSPDSYTLVIHFEASEPTYVKFDTREKASEALSTIREAQSAVLLGDRSVSPIYSFEDTYLSSDGVGTAPHIIINLFKVTWARVYADRDISANDNVDIFFLPDDYEIDDDDDEDSYA